MVTKFIQIQIIFFFFFLSERRKREEEEGRRGKKIYTYIYIYICLKELNELKNNFNYRVAIHFNNIMVNCFIEEARNEYSIEERLKNKTTPEEIAEFEKIGSLKKKKRPFEPLYRF